MHPRNSLPVSDALLRCRRGLLHMYAACAVETEGQYPSVFLLISFSLAPCPLENGGNPWFGRAEEA